MMSDTDLKADTKSAAHGRLVETVRRDIEAVWQPEGLSPIEKLPRAQIRAIQEQRLSAVFDYLMHCSPGLGERYRSAGLKPGDVRTLADLERLPILSRQDLEADGRAHPPWGRNSPLGEAPGATPWLVFHSSGSTSDPLLRRTTMFDREVWAWQTGRALRAFGVRPNDVAMSLLPASFSAAAWVMHEGFGRIGCLVYEGFTPQVPGMALPPQALRMSPPRMISRIHPTVMVGSPSGFLRLAREVEEQGLDPSKQGVRIIITAGEPGGCIPATRARLEKAWGAKVHDYFGCTEVAPAPAGHTCEEGIKDPNTIYSHFAEDGYIIEVLNPETLRPVAAGEVGLFVLSNIHSDSSPFLRYNMGDHVRVTEEPCACGRTSIRAVGGLLGRSEDLVVIRGKSIQRAIIEQALRAFPQLGDEYRVIVDGSDSLNVSVECAAATRPNTDDLNRSIGDILGVPVKLTLLDKGALPMNPGKPMRVVRL